jgi:hypothetical protein
MSKYLKQITMVLIDRYHKGSKVVTIMALGATIKKTQAMIEAIVALGDHGNEENKSNNDGTR